MSKLKILLVSGTIAVPYLLLPTLWLLAPTDQEQVPRGTTAERAAERERAEADDARAEEYQATVDTFDARMAELEMLTAEVAAEHREAPSKTEKRFLEEADSEIRRKIHFVEVQKHETEAGLKRIEQRQRGPLRFPQTAAGLPRRVQK